MSESELQEIIATTRPNPNYWSSYVINFKDNIAKKIFDETVTPKEPNIYPFAFATQCINRGLAFSFICNKAITRRSEPYESFLVFVYQTFEGENILAKIQKIEYNYDSK